MKEYRVTWEIDIDAATPTDAARLALEVQRDTSSLATVFSVRDKNWEANDAEPEEVKIDLGYPPGSVL